jgi:hypothetical protein
MFYEAMKFVSCVENGLMRVFRNSISMGREDGWPLIFSEYGRRHDKVIAPLTEYVTCLLNEYLSDLSKEQGLQNAALPDALYLLTAA